MWSKQHIVALLFNSNPRESENQSTLSLMWEKQVVTTEPNVGKERVQLQYNRTQSMWWVSLKSSILMKMSYLYTYNKNCQMFDQFKVVDYK